VDFGLADEVASPADIAAIFTTVAEALPTTTTAAEDVELENIGPLDM
jgi:hypothetical protein